jgi:hypothetical protein
MMCPLNLNMYLLFALLPPPKEILYCISLTNSNGYIDVGIIFTMMMLCLLFTVLPSAMD